MNFRGYLPAIPIALLLAGALSMAILWAGPGEGGPNSAPPHYAPVISTPIPVHTVGRPWQQPASAGDGPQHLFSRDPRSAEGKTPRYTVGENLAVANIYMINDFSTTDAIFIVGGISNTGATTQSDVQVRFFLGDPDDQGAQIGGDITIPSILPGSTVYDSVSWSGFTGSSRIHCLVDPCDSLTEVDEDDNSDSLSIGMVDQVPWVWQEVNGYCHYAGLTMLFNLYGAGSTVYETLELASCPYSVCYQDNWLGLMAGWGVCQAISDLEYAGQLRNLGSDLDIGLSWSYYLTQLQMWIDAGMPFETSVDPYYLPQPDYDICRTYGLHSGHAIVVVGYTDDAVIFNDPGVGLDLILEPPIPDPENRGANVVISLESFRNAVESTYGTSYLLLSYHPEGPMPSHQQLLEEILPQSIDRLDGYVDTYDPGFSLYYDIFGAPCFSFLREDATVSSFEAVLDAAMSQTGGDLGAALNILANGLDLWGCGIGWHGAAVFYGSQSYPQAQRLRDLSDRLSNYGDQSQDEYMDLLEAVYNNGGNTWIAGPYLTRIQSALDEVVALEDSVRIELIGLLGSLTEVESEFAATRLPFEPALACYPNPFNGRTVVRFDLPEDGNVQLSVYNILGQRVRVLADGYLRAGSHQVGWDGRGENGQNAASGVYFCRLERSGMSRTTKMLLLK